MADTVYVVTRDAAGAIPVVLGVFRTLDAGLHEVIPGFPRDHGLTPEDFLESDWQQVPGFFVSKTTLHMREGDPEGGRRRRKRKTLRRRK